MFNEDAANELCRMFFRKRARIWVGDASWRHDYDKPFTVEGTTYYLSRHYFYVRNDGRSTTLRPAKHLLETLRTVITEREREQEIARNDRVTSQLLRRGS